MAVAALEHQETADCCPTMVADLAMVEPPDPATAAALGVAKELFAAERVDKDPVVMVATERQLERAARKLLAVAAETAWFELLGVLAEE